MSTDRYNIEYQTFEALMAKVEDDLSSYSDNGYVEPDKYFGVVETCNSFLSTKINPMRECVVSIRNCEGVLPEDFKLANSAHVCKAYSIKQKKSGTTIEYKEVEVETEVIDMPQGTGDCADPFWTCNAEKYSCTPYQIFRKDTYEILEVTESEAVRMTVNNRYCNKDKNYTVNSSYNPYNRSCPEILNIRKSKGRFYVETNFDEGEMVLHYMANMVNEEGELMALDHALVSPYYEYAIKERILEDLYLNSGLDVTQKLAFIKNEHRLAKAQAYQFISMFDFRELGRVWVRNRKHFYRKYFRGIM